MNIEFLYFNDCPNHTRAFNILTDILNKHNVDAEIERIEIINDQHAVEHMFIGSPTIRINGVDADPIHGDQPFAKACRVYVINGKFAGLPSYEVIEKAVILAQKKAQ